jgi:hypothetical protein
MEQTNTCDALTVTFDMINATSQLMCSTDYPHWDFDVPSLTYDLPFLHEQGERAIFGINAQKLFKLDPAEIGRSDLALR